MHTYIHSYIHTYMHTYIHAYIHTHMHTYIHTQYIHTFIHTYIHTYIHKSNRLSHKYMFLKQGSKYALLSTRQLMIVYLVVHWPTHTVNCHLRKKLYVFSAVCF